MRSDIVSDVPSQHPDFFEVGFYSEQKRLSPAIRKILRRHGYFSEGRCFLGEGAAGEIAASLKAAISKHLKSGQKVYVHRVSKYAGLGEQQVQISWELLQRRPLEKQRINRRLQRAIQSRRLVQRGKIES